MRILYIATDVTFAALNGGSRRAYETAKIFQKYGHTSVVLVDKLEHESAFEIHDGIRVYRSKVLEIGSPIRNSVGKLLSFFKKESKKQVSAAPPSSQYTTYFPNLMNYDLKWKISDFYRHKLPLHKWVKTLPAIFRLIQIIKKEKIDVIIERGPSYGVGALVSKLFNRIYVFDFIDVMYSNLALQCANSVLSYFTDIQVPLFVNREKIQRVYTCADTEKFKPREKNFELLGKYTIGEKDFVAIYVGGMYPWHGLDTIVNAAYLIVQEGYKDIKFLLVGDGVVKKQIMELVAQKHLADNVKFTGRVDFNDVPTYLNSADVALSLNTGDAIGFKLIEYMASGTPIIAANADILHLTGQNNKEMLYVNLNDAEHLKEKILQLRNNPIFAAEIGKNARLRTEMYYQWDSHYKNILNAIKSAIKRKIK